jgi:large subunit ribosomal protein L14
MISVQTKIKISDNSGGSLAKCIKVIGLGNKRFGAVGDLLLITIKKKKRKFKKKIKKRLIYYGLVIMVKKVIRREDGTFVKFDDNRVLLFSSNDKKSKFLGTRIYGAIMKELRFHIHQNKKYKQKYFKLLSYCNSII